MRARRILAGTSVALLTIVATPLLVELFLRLVFPIPPSIEDNMYFEPDPVTGFRLKPGSLGYFGADIPARTNRHGHRDEDVSLSKPEGVFRILVLGDSFTVGANVRQEEIYTERLEDSLNESGETRVEVINTGVGGWAPYQYAQYFEHHGKAFEPDLVLIGFYVGNDAYASQERLEDLRTAVAGRRVTPEAGESDLIEWKIALYERSHLVRLLLRRPPKPTDPARKNCNKFSRRILRRERPRLSNYPKQLDSTKERLLGKNVAHVERIQRHAGDTPVVVVLIPDELQTNPHLREALFFDESYARVHDFDNPQTTLQVLFAEAGIEVIDLLEAFRADDRCLYLKDMHWSVAGHELASSVLAERLGHRARTGAPR